MSSKYRRVESSYGQSLSDRERQLLTLICGGMTLKGATRVMGNGRNTNSEYIRRMKRKTGAKNLIQLGVWARDNGYAEAVRSDKSEPAAPGVVVTLLVNGSACA